MRFFTETKTLTEKQKETIELLTKALTLYTQAINDSDKEKINKYMRYSLAELRMIEKRFRLNKDQEKKLLALQATIYAKSRDIETKLKELKAALLQI